MAGAEWGPKDQSAAKRMPIEVTRFLGSQLTGISSEVGTYLQDNPGATREAAITSISGNDKEANRQQAALDVLNQLSIVGRSGEDVVSVVVRDDRNSTIDESAGGNRVKSGAGKHHRYYEINWTREPDQLPQASKAPINNPRPQPAVAPHRMQPELRTASASEQRRKEEANDRRIRREIREREEQSDAIDDVVIDKVVENTQHQLSRGALKFELDSEGRAQVAIKHYGLPSDDYSPVDRETGEYNPTPKYFSNRFVIKEEYLKYYEYLMQDMEGKEPTYIPEPRTHEQCMNAFDQAMQMKVLQIVRNEGEITFRYLQNSGSFLSILFAHYRDIDLMRNMIVADAEHAVEDRPIHPDFVAFLKKKKEEIEQSLATLPQ